MLLSEQLLLEGVQDIKEMIFDKPEHIALAKRGFMTYGVSCHALYDERHDMTSSKDSHNAAVAKLFPKEYRSFDKLMGDYQKKLEDFEAARNEKAVMNLKKEIDDIVEYKHMAVPKNNNRAELLPNLYPYALQFDGRYACMYVTPDKLMRIKVIIDPKRKQIKTAFLFRLEDIDQRIVEKESIEMLMLKVYGRLNVTPLEKYAALKNYKASLLTNVKKDKLMNMFWKEQGVAPQVKQQVARQFDAQLANMQV